MAGLAVVGTPALAALFGTLGAGAVVGAIGGNIVAGLLAGELLDLKYGGLSLGSILDELTRSLFDEIDDFMAWSGDKFEDLEEMIKEYLKSKGIVGNEMQNFLDDLFGAESSSALQRVDPLSLDLDGDGIELVNVDNSTAFFDLDVTQELDANGNPTGNYISDGVKEQVGWVKGDDGLLVLDKNGNGLVDNILELFGKSNKTGTEELREYDLNNDGVINSDDAVFSELKVWQDVNQDGVSQSNELKTLSELNITSINVAANSLTELNQVNNNNLVISQGSYTKSDGTIGTYSNLDLAVNQANSSSYSYTDSNGNVVGDYDLNLDVLSLPFIRGYGNVEALPIAASKNSELLSSLKELRDLSDTSYNQIDALVEKVIYEWSGVNNISNITESSLRGNFSAQKLAAMENFRGQAFVAANGSSNSTTNQQFNLLTSAWNSLFEDVKLKLVVQSTFSDVFSYEVVTEIAESVEEITTTAIDPNTGEEITVTETVIIPASTSTETFSPVYDFASDSIDFNGVTADQVFANVAAKIEEMPLSNGMTSVGDVTTSGGDDTTSVEDGATIEEEPSSAVTSPSNTVSPSDDGVLSSESDANEGIADKINAIYAINDKVNFLNQIKEVLNVIANQNLITDLSDLSVRDNIEQISVTYLGEGSEALSALGLNLAYDASVANSSSISLSDEISVIANDNVFKSVLRRTYALF